MVTGSPQAVDKVHGICTFCSHVHSMYRVTATRRWEWFNFKAQALDARWYVSHASSQSVGRSSQLSQLSQLSLPRRQSSRRTWNESGTRNGRTQITSSHAQSS